MAQSELERYGGSKHFLCLFWLAGSSCGLRLSKTKKAKMTIPPPGIAPSDVIFRVQLKSSEGVIVLSHDIPGNQLGGLPDTTTYVPDFHRSDQFAKYAWIRDDYDDVASMLQEPGEMRYPLPKPVDVRAAIFATHGDVVATVHVVRKKDDGSGGASAGVCILNHPVVLDNPYNGTRKFIARVPEDEGELRYLGYGDAPFLRYIFAPEGSRSGGNTFLNLGPRGEELVARCLSDSEGKMVDGFCFGLHVKFDPTTVQITELGLRFAAQEDQSICPGDPDFCRLCGKSRHVFDEDPADHSRADEVGEKWKSSGLSVLHLLELVEGLKD